MAGVCRAVEEHGSAEVIVSTLPTTVSRWLRQDLPHRLERKVSVPVVVVTSTTTSPGVSPSAATPKPPPVTP